jgi:hypothetical protein
LKISEAKPARTQSRKTLPATLKLPYNLTQTMKIETNNYFDSVVQTTDRHDKPNASCFNFFPTAQKILKFFGSFTFGTFAVALTTPNSPMATANEPNFQTHYCHE